MAIRKPPRRNLPADAEKWGRYTDDTLRQAQVDIEALKRDLTSGLRATNSSLNRIAKQQEMLVSQQDILISQQAQLTSQQSSLEGQQQELATQQGQILELVNNMTTFKRDGGTIENESLGVNTRLLNRTSFTVPQGYSNALTFGVTSATFNNDNTTSTWMYLAVRTNLLPFNSQRYPAPANNWVWGSASGTQLITGLSGGETITVDSVGRSLAGTMSSGQILLDTIVIFTK